MAILRLLPFAVLLSFKETCKLVESVTIKDGPKNVTVREHDDAFMECVLTQLSQPATINRRWRLSGNEYTNSILPPRFFTNDTGLIINPVLLDDDGLTVQCFVVLFNSSTGKFITVDSGVGVVHVEARPDSIYTTAVPSTTYTHSTTAPVVSPTATLTTHTCTAALVVSPTATLTTYIYSTTTPIVSPTATRTISTPTTATVYIVLSILIILVCTCAGVIGLVVAKNIKKGNICNQGMCNTLERNRQFDCYNPSGITSVTAI